MTDDYKAGYRDCEEAVREEFLDLLKKITENEKYLTKKQVIDAMIEICNKFARIEQ